MSKLTSYILVGLTICATLCISCTGSGNKATENERYLYTCDESFRPIIEELRELCVHQYNNTQLDSMYTNETNAIKMFLDGKAFMAIATRELTQNEKDYLHGEYKTKPHAYRIGYDGFALIQNNENPDSCISVNDIKRILLGEVSDWKEIYPNSKMGKIQLVFDNPNSSNIHFAEDSILGGKPISKTNAVARNNSKEVISYIEKHKNAVGILGSGWLNDTHDTLHVTFRKGIRPMAVSAEEVATPQNSYQPFQAYFYGSKYPLTRTLWVWVNEVRGHAVTTFKNYIISRNQGQLVIFKAGLLPAYADFTIRELNVSR